YLYIHLIIRLPPPFHLFPYTTLFRSMSRCRRSSHRSGCKHRHSSSSRECKWHWCPCRPGTAPGHSAGEAHSPFHSRSHREGSARSEEHTSELQSHLNLVCRLLLEKKI